MTTLQECLKDMLAGGFDERLLDELEDGHMVAAYRVGDAWYISDAALRDLQHRLALGIKPEDCGMAELSRQEARELLRSLNAPRVTGAIVGGTLESIKLEGKP